MTEPFYYDQSFESPESSVVESAYYDTFTARLLVVLNQGVSYIYENFPLARWTEFLRAGSKGGYYSNNVTAWYNYSERGNNFSPVRHGNFTPSEAVTVWGDETQHDMAPKETLVPAAGAPSAALYEVTWSSGGVKSVFESTAHDEAGALVEFNDIISRIGLADVKIVSVTHYF